MNRLMSVRGKGLLRRIGESRLVLLSTRRNCEGEDAPALTGKFRPRTAPDRLDSFLHDAETESAAIRFGHRFVVRAEKLLKEVVPLVRRDTDPIVRDSHADFLVSSRVGPFD